VSGGTQAAAKSLADESTVAPIFSRKHVVKFYLALATLAVLLTVVDVTGVFGWEVSSTALGFLALLAVLPFADQIRKLKFGSFEAELAARVENMETLVTDLSDHVNNPEEPDVRREPGPARLLAQSADATRSAVLERIVWVDDRPAGNRLEMAELQKRFDVVLATNTSDGLRELAKSPETTMVITDAVRVEDGRDHVHAGRDLIAMIAERFPYVPIYVYCGPGSIVHQGEELERGTRLVTSSWTTLATQVRADARAAFEATVAEALREVAADLAAQTAGGVDFVAIVGGTRVAVEAKDWRRTPTASAFDTTVERLQHCLDGGMADRALLVTPRQVLTHQQVDRLPLNVIPVTPDGIASALRRGLD
jgi:hypothetical protein